MKRGSSGAREKGNRLELERQRLLEHAGALVERANLVRKCIGPDPVTGELRWVMNRADFFEVGDLIVSWPASIREGGGDWATHTLVSVSTLNAQPARRRKFEAKALELLDHGWNLELHARADRRAWRVWRRQPGALGPWEEVGDYLVAFRTLGTPEAARWRVASPSEASA